jgi:hypothetical protein
MSLRFELVKIQNRKSIAELESRFGADGFEAILKINRVDRRHIRVGDSLLVPNPQSKMNDSAPFPTQLEIARNIPKLILVSRRVQAFAAYESGTLVRWGPTSTGKKATPTPAGLYYTNWKAKSRRSSVNQSWILPWCFNLDDTEGISFHQFDLPGYPASHGCVRLLEQDAKWIFDWADQWTLSRTDQSILAYGTPVVVFGDYNYNQKPAWKSLTEDPNAAMISVKDIEGVLSKDLSAIELKARARRPENTAKEAPVVVASAPKVQ